jgi:acetyl esterase/lipase
MTIVFPQNEIDASLDFYRKNVATAGRLDFNRWTSVAWVKLLTQLAYLDKRPLRRLGLRAEERRVGTDHMVRVRVIKPKGHAIGVLVDIHGGGWTLGNAAVNDSFNAPRAAAGFAVVSIEYRFAPRYRFADLVKDCSTVLAWALADGEKTFGAAPVVLTGDSAGAHLSLAAAIACRTHHNFSHLKGMALFYGCYDLSATPSVRSASADTLVMYGPTLVPFFERIC